MRNRRSFVGALSAVVLAAPFAARGQSGLKRVIIINRATPLTEAFVAGLREHGWVDGRNLAFEVVTKHTDETAPKEIELAVARQPAVIVLPGPLFIGAAARLTNRIPIVGIDLESDPIAAGFAKSLARPGGNISGVWLDLPELTGKNVQLLRELLPGLDSLGVLWDERVGPAQFNAVQAVARTAKLTLRNGAVRAAGEIDEAIERLRRDGAKALIVLTAPLMFNNRERVVALALKHRLALASLFTAYADAGALLAYGPSLPGMFRQAAGHVDRILRGAKPGELPIERPVKFEFVLNAKTAQKLGIGISESLRIRADRIIEAA